MHYSKEQIAEIEILTCYSLKNTQQGIKVHSNANQEQLNAVQRLFHKGLITQIDGGYLTDLGITAAEHAQELLVLLAPHDHDIAI